MQEEWGRREIGEETRKEGNRRRDKEGGKKEKRQGRKGIEEETQKEGNRRRDKEGGK